MSDLVPPPETNFNARLGDRSLFPFLAPRVYANHAGISAPSVAVSYAAQAVYRDYERRGVAAFVTWLAQRGRLKGKLARLIGAAPDDIALTQNTTRGVIDIALCYPWNRGDRVIVFDGEFPSNVTPWQRAAAMFDLEVVFQSAERFRVDPAGALERLSAELARDTSGPVRLVAVSAVEFQTGFRMPVGAIAAACRAHGAEVFVDAVQACGVVPIRVREQRIDYLACGSHKWLMGVEGCGFLYARPERAEALRPNVAGWLSHEDGIGFLFNGEGHLRYDRPLKKTIDFIEGGNTNAAGFAGLEAAVDLILQVDVPSIFAHVTAYNDALETGLLARGFTSLRAKDPESRSGSLCVRPPAGISVIELHHSLSDGGIACAIPDGKLRFSPHWPNALSEVDVILAEVDSFLAGRTVS